jgi:Xaa-Pro aminopeptidase
MRGEIVVRQVQAISDKGLDAIVSCSPENFAYLTGFVVPSQALLRHRHNMTVVTADGKVALFGVDMEESTIRTKEPDAKLAVWAEFSDDPMQVLAALLEELGLRQARIGIELGYLPAADFAQLQSAMPRATFVACDAILARLRQIKTSQEVALLQRLSRIADRAITDAIAAVAPGDTEMDIAAHLTRKIYELGAQQFKLMIVATGERSQLPNVGPTDRRLVRGDVCRIEIFSIIDGYHAGVCRTAVVQEAPPHAEDVWRVLTECKHLLLDRIKPGASCRAIYDAFIAKLTAKSLPPISFVGHGIGLFLHEDPYLGRTPIIGSTEDAALEAGMVLGFEPLCYRTGHGFGMQNKDMVAVTDSGCELLSDYADTERLLKIG